MKTTIKTFLSSIRGEIPDEIEDLLALREDSENLEHLKNKRRNKNRKNNSKGDF